jgi:hypothetical protein
MSAEDAIAGNDDLKLVHIMEVWRYRCSGFLLDQEACGSRTSKGFGWVYSGGFASTSCSVRREDGGPKNSVRQTIFPSAVTREKREFETSSCVTASMLNPLPKCPFDLNTTIEFT